MFGSNQEVLLTQRIFKEVGLEMMDYYSHLVPTYSVDPLEKLLMPIWTSTCGMKQIKEGYSPTGSNPVMMKSHRYLSTNGVKESIIYIMWNTSAGECGVMLETSLNKFSENIDFTLLNRLLRLIMDTNIADYITSKTT